MSKKRETASKPFDFNGVATLQKIWKALTPSQWLSVFMAIAPQYRWQLKGVTITALCPYHNENTPSFKLQTTRGFGKCFGSCGKHVYDIVELVRFLRKCTYTEALLFLINEYNIANVLEADTDKLNEYHTLQEMKKQAAMAFNSLLIEFLRDSPKHLSYLVPAATYLIRGRNLDPRVIHRLPVGVFGKPEHVKAHFQDKKYIEEYDKYFGENSYVHWGKIIFHYNDSTGTISQFKCRDFNSQDVLKRIFDGKVWAEVNPVDAREICAHSFFHFSDPYAKSRGVFGLHKYSRLAGRESAEAYITEGEFDALAVMNAQELLGRQDFMVLATGGNANDITFLTNYDIKYLWVVPDHPSKRGNEYTSALLRHVEEKIRKNKIDLKFKIFQWPPIVAGFDLDEAIQLNGYEEMFKYLHVQRNDYFLNATPWVFKQCEAEIAEAKRKLQEKLIDVEQEVARANIEDAAKLEISTILAKWIQCLPDPADKAAFVRRFEEITGIDISKASDIKTAVYALDTFDGCVQALQNEIKEMFNVAYYEQRNQTNVITLWSKERFETVPVKESILDTIIAQYGCSDIITWAMMILKDSPYLKVESDDIGTMRKLANDVRFLANTAVNRLIHEAKSIQSLNKVGQGIHYEWLPASARANGYVYFVNGTKVFRGQFDKDTGNLNWVFINNIVDNDIIFKLNIQDRWSFVDDVTDLYEANRVNLNEVFQKLLTIIDGWKFENHDFMREYIAAWIMSIPVQRACGKVNMTFIAGDSNSGKTSMSRGLLGGGAKASTYEVPSVLEPAIFRSDATAAGMYQEMDASGLLFTIDEAETSEKHNTEHDKRVMEIQRMCYSIATGGHSISRGGITPDQRQTYDLQCPVLMCGININNDPVFLSRIMTIYTQKELNRRNVGDYIRDNFSNEDIEVLKRNITIGLIPRLLELKRIQTELQRTLPLVKTSTTTTGRFIDTLLPALSVYKLLGHNPETLFINIVESYKHRLEAITQGTQKMDLIHTVLYSKVIRCSGDDNYALQDARTLIMNGEINFLNNSSIGVYYWAKERWIVIVWRQVRHTCLRNTAYAGMDEAALAEACMKSPFVEQNISAAQHKKMIRDLGIMDIKTRSGYTVLRAEYLLSDDEEPTQPVETESSPIIEVKPEPEIESDDFIL